MPTRLEKAIFTAHSPTYRLFNRVRDRGRRFYESEADKHQRQRKTAEYLLISLTNCGRTWLRVMLGRAMQLAYGVEAVNLHDLFIFSELNPNLPSIKPIHEKYGQFGHTYQQHKVILLVRDPRDALVSRYYQHRKILPPDLNQYILEGNDLAAYIQFYNDWQIYQDTAKAFLCIRYEDLKQDTLRELSRIVDFLELAIPPATLTNAIEFAAFNNMKKLETEGSPEVRAGVLQGHRSPTQRKVRKGIIGGYREDLSNEAIDFLDQTISRQLNPIYGYSP